MIFEMKIKKIRRNRIVILILALAVFLTLYVFLSAKKQPVVYFKGLNAESIPYDDLISHMTETPSAYFFCTNTDLDCRFIDTEILNMLLIDAHVERFENIVLVDTKTLGNTVLPSALLARFGFSDFPAFALLSYKNGSIVVHNVLQWTNSNPLTMLDLKEWMKENKLWLAEYTN